MAERENCGFHYEAQYLTSSGREGTMDSHQSINLVEMQATDVQRSAEFQDDKGDGILQNVHQKLIYNPQEMRNYSFEFQNITPLLGAFGLEVGGIGDQIAKANEEIRQKPHGSFSKSRVQNNMSIILGQDKQRSNSTETNNQNTTGNSALEGSRSSRFQNKCSTNSELYSYLRSKMVECSYNFTPNVPEKTTREEDFTGKDDLKKKTLLLPVLKADTQNKCSSMRTSQEMIEVEDGVTEEPGLKVRDFQNLEVNETQSRCMANNQQNKLTENGETGEGDSGSKETSLAFRKSPVSEEDEKKMTESKLKLTSQVRDLTLELEKAENLQKKEQQYELNMMTANAKIRENALKLVEDVTSFAQNFSEHVMRLIEQEFSPGEKIVHNRVANATEWTNQIKKAMQEAENLLKEQDSTVFTSQIKSVELEIERCNGIKQDEGPEVKFDLAKLCPELEGINCEFRDKLGDVQRSLRSAFNPSEVTFDPETLHPNLVLSEDMKTVKFIAKKQQYSPSPKRFTSFFQVLSAQSFSAGVHRWEVELESAPWMFGVCAASALPRVGLPSALETCPLSWALMWNNNLLTALERGHTVPLKKTCEASRRLQVELDWDRRALTFYHCALSGANSLLHSFNMDTEEPLHLAYRMLSGDPKGRVTIWS